LLASEIPILIVLSLAAAGSITPDPAGFAKNRLLDLREASAVDNRRLCLGAACAYLLDMQQSEREWAQEVVRRAARRYLAERRARVDEFVDRHFGLGGTLRLHRSALGWDILRVPANLYLAPVALAMAVVARLAARLGFARAAAWLARRRPMFDTAMAREIRWLVTTELLQLPCEQPGRSHGRDGLAEAILADPEIADRLGAAEALSAETRRHIAAAIGGYAETRSATAEIAAGCFTAGLGALWVKHLTPGVMTLGGAVAGMLAQQAAIAAIPLGAWLGAWWYGMYPAEPSIGLIAATTAALAALGSLIAAFSGIVTDPIQRLLGVHRRRLLRLIDALERTLCDEAPGGFSLRDHYVARLLDLLDLTAALVRAVHA
jgi:hypothetical protein